MSKAVVLLSGGQDSTTCLFWAEHRLPGVTELHALSVMYGQRHITEIVAARTIAMSAGVATHYMCPLDIYEKESSALMDGSAIELKADGGLPDAEAPNGLPTSFVPGRNLLLLAAAAARAGAIGAAHIVMGVCETDYSGYPDCRRQFIELMQATIRAAWPSGVAFPIIHTPLMERTKADTVRLARELPGCWAALRKSVSCYNGEHGGCGTCPACVLRANGFAQAREHDPAVIAHALELGHDAGHAYLESRGIHPDHHLDMFKEQP